MKILITLLVAITLASTGQATSTPTPKAPKHATESHAPDLSYVVPIPSGVKLGWIYFPETKGSYRIVYGKSPASSTYVKAADSSPIVITGLEPGVTYYFSVCFIDSATNKASAFSSVQKVVVPNGLVASATPCVAAMSSATAYTPSESSKAAATGFGIVFLLFVLFCVAFYFLPTIIARNRHHYNATPIFVINFFLGWSLIGWVVALAWAFTTPTKTVTAFVQNADGTFAPAPVAPTKPKVPPQI